MLFRFRGCSELNWESFDESKESFALALSFVKLDSNCLYVMDGCYHLWALPQHRHNSGGLQEMLDEA